MGIGAEHPTANTQPRIANRMNGFMRPPPTKARTRARHCHVTVFSWVRACTNEGPVTSASNGREPTVHRHAWRGGTAAVYVMLLGLLTWAGPSCSEQSVGPSPPPPPLASLAIEDFSVFVLEGPCSYYYSEEHRCFRPRFILRETGGASGATLQDVSLLGPDGAEPGLIGGPACPHVKKIRVPPGGTSDIFHRDATNSGPDGYCYLWMDLPNRAEHRQLDLIIGFTSDDGRRHTFTTTVDVP